MKRKPSQQLVNVISNPKDLVRRLKSPQNKKTFIKKQTEAPTIIIPRHKVIKSKEQQKADSNNTTSTIKPKMNKNSKRVKYKSKQQMNGNQIMQIINSFATKIQKQWRVHAFRKRVKQFLHSLKIQNNQEEQVTLKPKTQIFQLKFDNTKIKRLVQFDQEQIQSGTTLYDKSKYYNTYSNKQIKSKSDVSIKSKNKKSSVYSKSSSSTPRNRVEKISNGSKTPKEANYAVQQLSRSLQRPSSIDSELVPNIQQRRASFNTFEQKKLIENRRHSAGQLQAPLRANSDKRLQVSKAYDLRIETSQKMLRKNIDNSRNSIRTGETEANIAFRKGSSIEKMMRKYKKQLEMKKFKQLCSVENRYTKNEVTYRSYLQIIGKINLDHSNKLEEIKYKQGQLKNTLGQLLQLYKSHPHENTNKFAEDDHQTSNSHLEVSLSFDRWDFNSSAKKSIIDPLDIPDINNSKVLSIESVLRQLDEEDGCLSDEKRFKKNKSLQQIQAIAQRSKQISQKDVCSFQKGSDSSIDAIAIEQVKTEEINEEELYHRIAQRDGIVEKQITPRIEPISTKNLQSQAIQLQNPIKSKESFKSSSSSQSLKIITSGPPQFSSQDEINLQKQDALMNELIFKQIHTSPDVEKDDPLLLKLKQIIIEKTIMTNIKIISSLKFVFAKAAAEKKKKKTIKSKLPSIHVDINNINAWLLEVSHFMLDNYEKVINQNIIKVKQPAASDVLNMARRQITNLPFYETIPEYVFKDFQFGYIRAYAKKYGVKDHQYDQFSGYLYTFHRAMVDSLNIALMDELPTGRQWIKTPWKTPQKFRAVKIHQDHGKVCLERVINMVSNWAEYNLGRLEYQEDFSQAEYRQFQEQKIFLVCRQQTQQARLNYTFSLGHILLKISNQIYQDELNLFSKQFHQLI